MPTTRWALSLGLIAALGCGDDDSSGPNPPPPGNGAAVAVRDNFFEPATVTAPLTDGEASVTWTWNGTNPHNVTFDAGGPNSETQSSGTFSRVFTEAGSFTYYCTVHGREVMSGSVEVE